MAAEPTPLTRAEGDARARTHLRLVAARRPSARHLVVLLLIAALGVFGVVGLSARASESAFRARRLESEVGALSARYEALTAEIAQLESPSRVRRVAENELGMVPAGQPVFLTLDGVRDLRAPAAAAARTPLERELGMDLGVESGLDASQPPTTGSGQTATRSGSVDRTGATARAGVAGGGLGRAGLWRDPGGIGPTAAPVKPFLSRRP
jgi:cell division protein FtsL